MTGHIGNGRCGSSRRVVVVLSSQWSLCRSSCSIAQYVLIQICRSKSHLVSA